MPDQPMTDEAINRAIAKLEGEQVTCETMPLLTQKPGYLVRECPDCKRTWSADFDPGMSHDRPVPDYLHNEAAAAGLAERNLCGAYRIEPLGDGRWAAVPTCDPVPQESIFFGPFPRVVCLAVLHEKGVNDEGGE